MVILPESGLLNTGTKFYSVRHSMYTDTH